MSIFYHFLGNQTVQQIKKKSSVLRTDLLQSLVNMATSSSALLRAPRLRFSSSSTLSTTPTSFSASSSQAYAWFANQKQSFFSMKAFRSLRWSATTRWSHGVNWRGCGSSVSLRAQARAAAPILDRNLSTSGTLFFLLASECIGICMYVYVYVYVYA